MRSDSREDSFPAQSTTTNYINNNNNNNHNHNGNSDESNSSSGGGSVNRNGNNKIQNEINYFEGSFQRALRDPSTGSGTSTNTTFGNSLTPDAVSSTSGSAASRSNASSAPNCYESGRFTTSALIASAMSSSTNGIHMPAVVVGVNCAKPVPPRPVEVHWPYLNLPPPAPAPPPLYFGSQLPSQQQAYVQPYWSSGNNEFQNSIKHIKQQQQQQQQQQDQIMAQQQQQQQQSGSQFDFLFPVPVTASSSIGKRGGEIDPLALKRKRIRKPVPPERKPQVMERNRVAAKKCRSKRRNEETQLYDDFDQLIAENAILRGRALELDRVIGEIKGLLNASSQCFNYSSMGVQKLHQ